MKLVAVTTVRFESPTGECSAELEEKLAELSGDIEYKARQIAKEFDLQYEVEES